MKKRDPTGLRGTLKFFLSGARDLWKSWKTEGEAWQRFEESLAQFRQMSPPDRQPAQRYLYPCLHDATGETQIEPVYFYQDSWAFERIVDVHPDTHLDVGSHHKYVALLSKVVSTTMVDIRPLSLPLESLDFVEGSILDLPFEDGVWPSVSSLCVVEHVGLGRYGDPLDPWGSEKAIEELKRVVAPEGFLYLSVPIDSECRVYFNAHRAFTESYLLELFEPFEVIERRYIYGRNFCEVAGDGFGIGCYQLQRPPR